MAPTRLSLALGAVVLASAALLAPVIDRAGRGPVGESAAVKHAAASLDRIPCDETPLTLWTPSNHFFSGPIGVLIGGDLASDRWRVLEVGNYWYLRDQAPRPTITLLAERLDEAAQPIRFEADGYHVGPGLPREWTAASHYPAHEISPNPLVSPGHGGWYYRTSVTALEILPQEGCWRVSWLDGDLGDAIIYRVAPEPRVGSKWGP